MAWKEPPKTLINLEGGHSSLVHVPLSRLLPQIRDARESSLAFIHSKDETVAIDPQRVVSLIAIRK